jgi:hypothetical protein
MPGQITPPRYSRSPGDDIERRPRAEVHDDERRLVPRRTLPRGDGVDDAVGADVAGGRVANRDAGVAASTSSAPARSTARTSPPSAASAAAPPRPRDARSDVASTCACSSRRVRRCRVRRPSARGATRGASGARARRPRRRRSSRWYCRRRWLAAWLGSGVRSRQELSRSDPAELTRDDTLRRPHRADQQRAGVVDPRRRARRTPAGVSHSTAPPRPTARAPASVSSTAFVRRPPAARGPRTASRRASRRARPRRPAGAPARSRSTSRGRRSRRIRRRVRRLIPKPSTTYCTPPGAARRLGEDAGELPARPRVTPRARRCRSAT